MSLTNIILKYLPNTNFHMVIICKGERIIWKLLSREPAVVEGKPLTFQAAGHKDPRPALVSKRPLENSRTLALSLSLLTYPSCGHYLYFYIV